MSPLRVRGRQGEAERLCRKGGVLRSRHRGRKDVKRVLSDDPKLGAPARTPPQTRAQNTLSTRPPPGQKDRRQVRADGGGRRGLCNPRGTGSAGARPTAAFSPRPLTPRAPDEVLVLGERCWGRPEEARACCSHPEISSGHAAFDPRSPFPPRAGEREVGRAARLDPAQEGPAGQGEGYRPGT